MQLGMMIAGIVCKYQYSASRMAAYLVKFFQEPPIRFSVKGFGLFSVCQLFITQAHGTKVANPFSCWMMEHNGVFTLMGHPHSTP